MTIKKDDEKENDEKENDEKENITRKKRIKRLVRCQCHSLCFSESQGTV